MCGISVGLYERRSPRTSKSIITPGDVPTKFA
jgi:hypothetical protein